MKIRAYFLRRSTRPLFEVRDENDTPAAVVTSYHEAEILAGLKPERRRRPRREVRAVVEWEPVRRLKQLVRFETV